MMNGSSGQPGDANVHLQLKRDPDEIPEAKQMRIQGQSSTGVVSSSPYVAMQFTWSGSLLLGLDAKSQLHLYKIHPNIDPSKLNLPTFSNWRSFQILANHVCILTVLNCTGTATAFIELSMMGGLDPWDILMCLRPSASLIENVSDRLSETFARQPPPIQAYYSTRMLVIKAALHRYCGWEKIT